MLRSFVLVSHILVLGLAASPDRVHAREARASLDQDEIAAGRFSLRELRRVGLEVFAVPFVKAEGYGDGPPDPSDPISFGGRPTLQNNGTYLRVNGLDAQACVECHAFVSSTEGPVQLGIGGFGGIINAPIFMPREIDVGDDRRNGFAFLDGRLIVPPHLFGSGGVQLLAKEMTAELQALRERALAHPGEPVELRAKGVFFGTIVADRSGRIDPSQIEGVAEDLVVRPFGRKGEFSSVRQFDLVALQFHLGIQPSEVVGEGVDADGDGVVDEATPDQVSALEIFITTMESPQGRKLDAAGRRGRRHFRETGCGDCHRTLQTWDSVLAYSLPEIATAPFENAYYEVDLAKAPPRFRRTRQGGLDVPLFSDLKRHDMGPDLAETFHGASERQNREFITAKLWGVGDSAPYLHDGRAQTLREAIELHGGEALDAREAFVWLAEREQEELLAFLRSLRLPRTPNTDVTRTQ
jgi:hypothetical protein